MPDSLPTATDPEADLLRRWRDQRDRAALDELAGRLMPAGWRAARAFAREHAEDVLQDAFLTLTTGAAGWRGGAVRSWFVGIVANTARDHLRRQRRRPAPLPPELPAPPEPSAPELAERVMAALLRLPEHERVPLWLNVVEGQDCGDIAVQLGRPAGTVRSQVARAFERLRGQFGGAVAVTAISTALHQQAWAAEPPAGLAAKLGDSAAVAKAVGTATIPMAVLAVAVAVTVAVASTMLLWYRPPTAPVRVAPADAMVPLPDAPPAASVRVLGAGPFQHDNYLESIAISPDGTRMAVGTEKGLHVWDIASGRQLLTIDTPPMPDPRFAQREHKTKATHLIWLPGDLLLGSLEYGVKYLGLWEASTGRLIRRIPIQFILDGQPAMVGDDIFLYGGRQYSRQNEIFVPRVFAVRLDNGSELPPIDGVAPEEATRNWEVGAIAVDANGARVACLTTNDGQTFDNTKPVVDPGLSKDMVLSVWSWPGRIKLAERRLPRDGSQERRLEWLADGRLVVSSRASLREGKRGIFTIILSADLSVASEEPGLVFYATDGSRLRVEDGRATLLAADGGKRTLTGWTAPLQIDSRVTWQPGRILAMLPLRGSHAPWLYDLAADRLLAPAPATLARSADSLIWLPDGSLLAANYNRTLCFADGTGEARILPHGLRRHGAGDPKGGRAWGWQDGKVRVLGQSGLLLDPSGANAPRDLELPTGYMTFTAVSPDLRWAFVRSENGTRSLLDLNDGTLAWQWKLTQEINPTSVRWVGDQLLISDAFVYGIGSSRGSIDQSMTGVWSLQSFQRLHRFRRTDGSEIQSAVDVVPHPDGERALVVPNDDAKQRAYVCRIADGACLDEIASPGSGAVWTADGSVVAGRMAAISLATRLPTCVFADLHAPLTKSPFGSIGLVQPSPSGTQVAVCAGDRLLVVDARSGAVCATIPLGRNLVPALAAWSPGETEIALADGVGPTVVVVTVAQASVDAAADSAILADAAKPVDQRRAALARLEAATRAGATPTLPEAGRDALLAAWLADAAHRAAPVLPEPSVPAQPQPAPGAF